MTAVLDVRDLHKTFVEGEATREVLRGASFVVNPGELVALVGRSGSGKSTLLNLIAGIDRPTAGEVWVAGEALGRLSERQRTLVRREKIGFVFQFFNLLPTLTLVENVLLPRELGGRGADAQARADALRLLDAVGLADRAAAFPDHLSGGEQQRASLARALIHEPALVLADEPTGALDAETGNRVLALFVTMARERGTSVVLVTHSGEVAAAADRVLRLDGGVVTEVGGSW
jgi:putative ABC transport system ATP-binding protein